MAEVKFYRCTRAQFNTRKEGDSLSEGELYYITDEGCIERATGIDTSELYGKHVELLPANYDFTNNTGRSGVLYICNGVGKIYSNNSWTDVFTIDVGTTASSIVSGNEKAVSGGAVYSYITTNYVKGTAEGNIPVLGTGGRLVADRLPSNVVYLDTNNKIDSQYIPNIAFNEYVGTFTTTSGLTSLTSADAQKGDWARVYDSSDPDAAGTGTYILNASDPTVLSNWILMADTVDKLTIDSALNSRSTNPVSNSVITTALNGKIDNPTSSEAGKFLSVASGGTVVWTDPVTWTDLTSNS